MNSGALHSPHPRLRSPLFALLAASLALAGLSLPVASAFAVPASSTATSAAMTTVASTTVGPRALRDLVQDAATSSQEQSLDLGGIVWLEHLNLVVGDMDVAMKFYVDFLGLSRDNNPKHFNLGQQQFHLAANGDPPQRVTGSIGLTVPSLQRIRERMNTAQADLEETLFSVIEDDKNILTVTCPWGNIFHLYDISLDGEVPETCESPQKMVKMHAEGGAYGPHRMSIRGSPGIRYVEIACRVGTAHSIARFYEEMLGCQVTRTKAAVITDATTNPGSSSEVEAAVVTVGPGVHVAFMENESLSDDVVNRMEGVHACFYVPNFQSTYNTLMDRNLIWTNPRFTHLDSCDTWEEARASRTLRFRDILDLATGEKVLEFEHETRPMLHGQYLKVPPYTPN